MDVIDIPKDLIHKTDREIKEIISEVGLTNFSKIFSIYLMNPKNLESLKDNPELLEKVAFTLDSILMYHQMTKNKPESKHIVLPDNDSVNRFVEIYSLFSKEKYVNCRS